MRQKAKKAYIAIAMLCTMLFTMLRPIPVQAATIQEMITQIQQDIATLTSTYTTVTEQATTAKAPLHSGYPILPQFTQAAIDLVNESDAAIDAAASTASSIISTIDTTLTTTGITSEQISSLYQLRAQADSIQTSLNADGMIMDEIIAALANPDDETAEAMLEVVSEMDTQITVLTSENATLAAISNSRYQEGYNTGYNAGNAAGTAKESETVTALRSQIATLQSEVAALTAAKNATAAAQTIARTTGTTANPIGTTTTGGTTDITRRQTTPSTATTSPSTSRTATISSDNNSTDKDEDKKETTIASETGTRTTTPIETKKNEKETVTADATIAPAETTTTTTTTTTTATETGSPNVIDRSMLTVDIPSDGSVEEFSTTKYVGTVTSHNCSGNPTETSSEQRGTANGIMAFLSAHNDKVAAITDNQDVIATVANPTEELTFKATLSINLEPTKKQEAAINAKEGVDVEVTSTTLSADKTYLVMHESNKRAGQIDLFVVEGQPGGTINVHMEDLSPIHVAELGSMQTADAGISPTGNADLGSYSANAPYTPEGGSGITPATEEKKGGPLGIIILVALLGGVGALMFFVLRKGGSSKKSKYDEYDDEDEDEEDEDEAEKNSEYSEDDADEEYQSDDEESEDDDDEEDEDEDDEESEDEDDDEDDEDDEEDEDEDEDDEEKPKKS